MEIHILSLTFRLMFSERVTIERDKIMRPILNQSLSSSLSSSRERERECASEFAFGRLSGNPE